MDERVRPKMKGECCENAVMQILRLGGYENFVGK